MTITIRDTLGVLITNLDDLFSETIFIGSGTYTARFRVYNNYDELEDQRDIQQLEVYLTGSPKNIIPHQFGGIGLSDWGKSPPSVLLLEEMFSGVCKVASKQQGGNPLLESGTINHINPIDDEECDYIYSASGSDNFNEYEVSINIPSDTVFDAASGTVYITLKYKYV
jgi:hypothetical protein